MSMQAAQESIGHHPQSNSTTPAGRLKFGPSEGFQAALKRRVDEYFHRIGRDKRDSPKMYVKTGVIIGWFAVSYILLVFGSPPWWLAAALAVSVGLAAAAVGFNIQHDASHQAYSKNRWINRALAFTLDLLGGSSYIWARKHNSIHHSFTNITGHDDDINVGWFGRLSPHQPWRRFHRLQQFYLWFLYGFLPMKWHLIDDFRNVLVAKIGDHQIQRPQGWDRVLFFGGKLAFFTLIFGIPMFVHPWWVVLLFYAGASFVLGVVLSVVFQLAHCVEGAEFPMPIAGTGSVETCWAIHQVETTVDFAPRNRLLSWYIGGLNFQIEHHLFPQICHVHYPAIAPLVEQTCADYGVRYKSHRTFREAVVSHYRWLREMGRATPALA